MFGVHKPKIKCCWNLMMSNDMLQQNSKIVRLAHNFNLENKLEYKLKTIKKTYF